MLPSTPYEVGKGQLSSIANLLASGPAELTAEEEAQQREAVLAVQREMEDADELNYLDEEDMHVFDRQPLEDKLSLVSCNMCRKPIKASAFSAHHERCKAMMAQDDSTSELDGGAGHKKPPRKARKKLLSSEDNTGEGDSDRLADDDDLPETAGVSGAYEEKPPVHGVSGRGTKKVMNISEGTVVAAPKVGRPRKQVVIAPGDGGASADVVQPPPKRPKLLTTEELDTLCGVFNNQTGVMCRRSITCKLHAESAKRAVQGRLRPYEILLQEFKANKLAAAPKPHNTVAVANPLPLATKEYCHRPEQCMRAVLGSLFSDACNRRAVNRGNSPDRLSGEFGGQVLPALTLPSDQSSDLQTLSGFNQKKAPKLGRDNKKVPPVQVMQMAHVKAEPGLNQAVDYSRVNMSSMGLPGVPNYQHLDNRLALGGMPVDYGQLVMNKGRPVQGLPVLGTNVSGTSNAW